MSSATSSIRTLAVESGAYFDGRSMRAPATNVRRTPEKLNGLALRKEPLRNGREPAAATAA